MDGQVRRRSFERLSKLNSLQFPYEVLFLLVAKAPAGYQN